MAEGLLAGGSHVEREDHDALGNVTRRISGDRDEVGFEYLFDARGNWVSRETIRVDGQGARSVTNRERREIQYW